MITYFKLKELELLSFLIFLYSHKKKIISKTWECYFKFEINAKVLLKIQTII